MNTHGNLHHEDEEMETGSLNPESLDYIEYSLRELGKHISDLNREEEII